MSTVGVFLLGRVCKTSSRADKNTNAQKSVPSRLSGLRVLPKPRPSRFVHESDRVSVVHGHGPRRFCLFVIPQITQNTKKSATTPRTSKLKNMYTSGDRVVIILRRWSRRRRRCSRRRRRRSAAERRRRRREEEKEGREAVHFFNWGVGVCAQLKARERKRGVEEI